MKRNPFYKGTEAYATYDRNNNPWHSPEDEPAINQRVLVYTTYGDTSTATYEGNGRFYVDHCHCSHKDVRAWMPVPEYSENEILLK